MVMMMVVTVVIVVMMVFCSKHRCSKDHQQ